jgi:hypothetical protein
MQCPRRIGRIVAIAEVRLVISGVWITRNSRIKELLPPSYLIHAHRLLEPLRHELPAVREAKALTGAEAAHRVRDEDLAAFRLRRDAGGEDDGGAEEVAVFFDRLARVEAYTDRQSFESLRTSG